MIPGVSRSAATIIGGLTQKLNKKAAAEFSFFLAVPTMFAATAKKLLDFEPVVSVSDGLKKTFSWYRQREKGVNGGVGLQGNQIMLLVIGNVVAFFVALLAIRSFVSYLTKHGFKIFGYYRIIVGLAILILYGMGYNLQII